MAVSDSRDTRTVSLSMRPGRAQLKVDDVDISNAASAVTVSFDSKERRPEVTVTLSMVEAEINGEAVLHVHPACREALIRLGWTPPQG